MLGSKPIYTFCEREKGSWREGEGPFLPRALQEKDVKEKLLQWGLESGLKSVALRFTGSFRASEAGLFLREMFSCPDVQAALQLSSMTEGVGAAASSESIPATTVQSVEFEELRCSVLSMSFFNRLSNGIICSEGGRIKGMFEESFGDLIVSDCLRELLANPQSDNLELYGDQERQEFIYRLLQLVAIGGAISQPEEELESYLSVVKALYKEMVSVFKHSKTGVVQTASAAFSVSSINNSKTKLWTGRGGESLHNSCLVTVDPKRGHAAILLKEMVPFW